ncbi:MAG TPA: DMT family transporter [Opitutaceae bacterium]|nr:DMT family transporter [Opitutaceae bacterium]
MSFAALTLVLAAAGLHATWNLCAKRAGGGLPFVFVVGCVISTLYVPVVVLTLWHEPPRWAWLDAGWILGSGLLKTGYSLFLQRSYRAGDFSLIYPLARGTGPLLATAIAIGFLGERPSILSLAGAGLIIVGILVITGGTALFRREAPQVRTAIRFGLMSGVFIAAYTVWDQQGVARLGIRPLLYDAGTAWTQLALLLPFAIPRWSESLFHWKTHRSYVFAVALLSPVAYVLVLMAMTLAPLSSVAPAREISILVGAFLGTHVLKEGEGGRRIFAAAIMAAGVIALVAG